MTPPISCRLAVACALLLACVGSSQVVNPDGGGGGGDGGSSGQGSGGAAGTGTGAGGSVGAGGGGGSSVDAAVSGSGGRIDAGAGAGGRGGSGGGSGGAGAGGRAGSGGGAGSGGAGAGGAAGRTGTLRIMPLGDSTTGSVCWRALLWQRLNQAGHTGRFDFIGSRNSDAGCTPTNYDKDNEGHPGVLVTDFINDADDQVAGVQTLASLFNPRPADVVLLHFATNDVWNARAPATILAAYSTVVDALRAANPNVVVLVAKLIPMNPINTATCSTCACSTCGAGIVALDNMIPAWATGKSTTASPLVVVDQWTGFDATAGVDTADGVHPNASGSQKISDKWFTALTPYFQ